MKNLKDIIVGSGLRRIHQEWLDSSILHGQTHKNIGLQTADKRYLTDFPQVQSMLSN